MTELRRWSAEDATSDELRLLEASRGERPDPAARARTLAALGIGADPGGGSSSGAGGTTRAAPVKLLALGAGAIALGAAIFGIARARHDAGRTHGSSPARAAQISPREPPRPALAMPAMPSAEPGDVAPPAEAPAGAAAAKPARRASRAARPARGGGESVAANEPSLAEEVAALDRARAGLAADDPAAALRSLDAYRARFAHGRLAAEEIVLRVQALLARGDRAGAAAVARAFSQSHPDSAYVARLRALVRAAGE